MNETAAVIKGPMVFAVFNPLNCSGFFFFFFGHTAKVPGSTRNVPTRN